MGMCSRGRYGFDSGLSNVLFAPHNDFKSFLNQLSKLYKLTPLSFLTEIKLPVCLFGRIQRFNKIGTMFSSGKEAGVGGKLFSVSMYSLSFRNV